MSIYPHLKIRKEAFDPPFLCANPHVQTIFPALFHRGPDPGYVRKRFFLSDDDFIDLDWVRQGCRRVVVLVHGLEGSATQNYMRTMAQAFKNDKWDVVALNLRGCSGELNYAPRLYHAGDTGDLDEVLHTLAASGAYEYAGVVGFSLGGNIVLKLMGERQKENDFVMATAALSVPCDLAGSANQISANGNQLYLKYFLRSLKKKVALKARQFPGLINVEDLDRIDSFYAFDNRYTAQLHGFKDAMEYWTTCSSQRFLPHINVPTLIVNADDDPFLTDSCYPHQQARQNPYIHLHIPSAGGHMGFWNWSGSWLPGQVLSFFSDLSAAK